MLYIVQAMPVVVRFPEPKHSRKKDISLTEFTYQLAYYTDDIYVRVANVVADHNDLLTQ